MKILVNCLFIRPKRNHGTQTYCVGVLDVWKTQGVDFIVLTNNEMAGYFTTRYGPGHVAVVRLGNRLARVVYEQAFLSRKAALLGADVLYCPGYLGPVFSVLPVVVTVHDMQYRDIRQYVSFWQRFLYGLVIPPLARRAVCVLTVSEFSKSRIKKHLAISDYKIIVTHEAPQPFEEKSVDDHRGRPYKYLLCVAGSAPHKNLKRLIRAYESVFDQTRQDPVRLVIVGSRPPDLGPVLPCENLVVYKSFVDDAELGRLYDNALGFVFPSLYEGFGLPVLEAMAAGIPVASSRCGSLPEIVGDAGLFFDATNEAEISTTLLSIINDEALREDLIKRGRENLKRFSWQDCARKTYSAIVDSLKAKRSSAGCSA